MGRQFLTAIQRNSPLNHQLKLTLPGVSDAKLLNGIVTGPQLRKLFESNEFCESLNDLQKKAWRSLIDVTSNFLGSHRSDDYNNLINIFLSDMKDMGSYLSPKLHFLQSHISEFGPDCASTSDEHGERFHQQLKSTEQRYSSNRMKYMICDYLWLAKNNELFKNV
jgi:hypothetical protein